MVEANIDKKLPIDRGWAWVICLGGFITHTILGCGGQINSVLFVELVERFGTTITTASLIFMCHILAFSISTVAFPTLVLPKLGERWILVLGGCLLFTASIGCAFSPSIGVFITFSVLKGTASGCVFVPCCCLIRVYFKQRLSTASVLAYCGGSVAAIVAPFVIRAVRTEYGISGAYFIQAAVELNVCVAGMLMRPASSYSSRCQPKDESEDSEVPIENGLLSTDIKAQYPSADKVFLEKGEFNIFSHQWNRQLSATHRSDQLPTIDEHKFLAAKLPSKSKSQEKPSIDGTTSSLQGKLSSEISTSSGRIAEPHQSPAASVAGSRVDTALLEKNGSQELAENISNSRTDIGSCSSANGSTSNPVFVSCSNADELLKSQAYQALLEQEKCLLSRELSVDERPKAPYGSVFTLASEAGRAIEVLLIEEITSQDGRKGIHRWRDLYNNSSLGLWSFRMTLIAALPGTVNQYLVAYLPTITHSQGASYDEAANLVTIMGVVDLFSRLGMGLIADTKIVPPSRMLAIAQVIMGTVCQFAFLFTSFPLLILMVILMGLFVGSRISLLPLVCTEVVGSEKMPRAYSISAMSTALMGATWSPVLGAIAQSTKSFVVVMHFIGTGYLLSGLLMFTLTFFSNLDKKRAKKVLDEDTKMQFSKSDLSS
uniref:Major facilitator superfamily (MFS) profile domain-containing protein n=1 Tax=Arion vulgaris TaxID=1028688 RepID=A0A0B6ZNR6_9EUPU